MLSHTVTIIRAPTNGLPYIESTYTFINQFQTVDPPGSPTQSYTVVAGSTVFSIQTASTTNYVLTVNSNIANSQYIMIKLDNTKNTFQNPGGLFTRNSGTATAVPSFSLVA